MSLIDRSKTEILEYYRLSELMAGNLRIELDATREALQQAEQKVLEIRKRLWLNHGHDGLYGDDGEMQCNLGGCMLDFKRDSLEKIINRINEQSGQTIQRERETSEALRKHLMAAQTAADINKQCALIYEHKQPFCAHKNRYTFTDDGGKSGYCVMCQIRRERELADHLAEALETNLVFVDPGTNAAARIRAALAQHAAARSGK